MKWWMLVGLVFLACKKESDLAQSFGKRSTRGQPAQFRDAKLIYSDSLGVWIVSDSQRELPRLTIEESIAAASSDAVVSIRDVTDARDLCRLADVEAKQLAVNIIKPLGRLDCDKPLPITHLSPHLVGTP